MAHNQAMQKLQGMQKTHSWQSSYAKI